MLTLHKITKAFGGVTAIADLSLTISIGGVTSLIGPNGAGKTTLFNLISGFYKPDSGIIDYNGHRLDRLSPYQVARCGIGRLFQDVRVFRKLSVMENVLLAASNPSENPMRALLFRGAGRRRLRQTEEVATFWLEEFDLISKRNSAAEHLSYGQQKLVALARLLVGNCELLLLDEPVSGVSTKLVGLIGQTIERLTRIEKKTVIIIEHDMGAVRELSDHVYYLLGGRVLSSGSPEVVLSDANVRRSYLLS